MTKCHHYPNWATSSSSSSSSPPPPLTGGPAQSHTLPPTSSGVHHHHHQFVDIPCLCCCPNRTRCGRIGVWPESSPSPPSPHHHHGRLAASARVLSLIGLSLVFILIWSSILSSILIVRSVREQEFAASMAEQFDRHKQLSQLVFAAGQQMLLVDLREPETEDQDADGEELFAQQVAASLATNHGVQNVQNRIDAVRSRCRNENQSSPVQCVQTFSAAFEAVADEMVQHDQSQQMQRHSRGTATDLALRGMPYVLFVRGMIHRFTALGLGLALVRSNFQNSALNVSEYFQHYYCSRRQIESSFLWNVRAQQKYLELEQSEYQTDMLVHLINNRLVQQQEMHTDMALVFAKLFTADSLDRINTYIKKRNAESIERLMVMNGTNALYVADEEANNQVSVPLDAQFLESFGLPRLERIATRMAELVVMRSPYPWQNLTQQYETVVRNQVRFLARVQDFLNVSIYAHLAQSVANEQTNLVYHLIAVVILVASVLFCLVLFTCSWLCSRRCHHAYQCGLLAGNRRLRRRGLFWPLISPFKRSNSGTKSLATGNGITASRNPLLSGSGGNGCACHRIRQSPAGVIKSKSNCQTNVVFPCSSPNAFLVSSSSKRTFAGGVINRYSATPIAGTGTAATKTAVLTYKFENSRGNGPAKTGRCHCGGSPPIATESNAEAEEASSPPVSRADSYHQTSPKNKSATSSPLEEITSTGKDS